MPISKWRKIYEREINKAGGIDKYFQNKINSYDKLIESILKYTPKNGKILESGSGTGLISIYLSKLGHEVIAVDSDKAMLSLSASIANKFLRKPQLINENLFKLSFPEDFFDVTFNNGVFEHFTDNEIVDLTNKLLKISKTLIISVPSNYYGPKDRMYGDERFLSKKYWLKLFDKTEGKVVEIVSYLFKNKFDHLKCLLKIKVPSYLAFVIKKR